MPLTVIKTEEKGAREMVVYVKGDTIPELDVSKTTPEAMKHARANGFPAFGVDPVATAPYAVDDEGNVVENAVKQKTAGYVREVRVKAS